MSETCFFTMNFSPNITHSEEGKRSAKKSEGSFYSKRRMSKNAWMVTKPYATHYSDEDIEDGIGGRESGWDYSSGALFDLIKSGRVVSLNGIECITIKELYDAYETIPQQRKEYTEAQEQKKNQLLTEKNDVIRFASVKSGKEQCADFSWDDFRFSLGTILAESEHFVAQEYKANDEVIGFVVKDK